MKKLLYALFSISLLFGSVGCSNSSSSQGSTQEETTVEEATLVIRLQDLDVEMTDELVNDVVKDNGFNSGKLDEDEGVVTYTMSLEKAQEYKDQYLEHIGNVFQNRLDQEGSNIRSIKSDGNYEVYIIRIKSETITEDELEEFEALVDLAMKNIHSLNGINKYEYEYQYVDDDTDEVVSTTTGTVENTSSSFSYSI